MQRRGKDLRIGNPEREQAIKLLGEHLTAGRLDIQEYDQRCAQAAAAKFNSEITTIFEDLPQPGFDVRQPPVRHSSPKNGNIVLAVSVAVAVVLLAVVAKQIWVLALVALAAAIWFGRHGGSR